MEDRELSPEEKLLRLIKKGKTESAFGPEEKIKLPKAKMPLSEYEKEKASKENILYIKEKNKSLLPESGKSGPLKKEEVSLLAGEKLLFTTLKADKKFAIPHISYLYAVIGAAVFFIIILFMFNLFTGKEQDELKRLEKLITSISESNTREAAEEDSQKKAAEHAEEGSSGKVPAPFEDYQKMLNEKSIFAPPAASSKKKEISTAVTLREMTKDFRLVGIVPGDEPQAIVEDKRSGQTLFLKKGEFIGEIEIADISAGKIMLMLGEETLALSL
ncbi:MAG: hypothetical protein ABH843_00975 [Candidatus Omnitrophota bacterium]